MLKKIGFGRCALPHLGHVEAIALVDVFVLSNSSKLPNSAKRLALLKELGADISKVVVGNPYKILKALSTEEGGDEVAVVAEAENASLPKALSIKTISLQRKFGLSSTLIKSLLKSNELEEVKKYYGTPEALNLATQLYEEIIG